MLPQERCAFCHHLQASRNAQKGFNAHEMETIAVMTSLALEHPSVFVCQTRCKVTRLSLEGNHLCSARIAHFSGMEGAVVPDQLFQYGSPVSAKQFRLKQLVDVPSLSAFRLEGSDTLYWMAIHADHFRDYLGPLPTHPSDAAWWWTWGYMWNDFAERKL